MEEAHNLPSSTRFAKEADIKLVVHSLFIRCFNISTENSCLENWHVLLKTVPFHGTSVNLPGSISFFHIFSSISQPTKGGPKTCPCHVLGINACLPPDVASLWFLLVNGKLGVSNRVKSWSICYAGMIPGFSTNEHWWVISKKSCIPGIFVVYSSNWKSSFKIVGKNSRPWRCF